MAADTLEAGAPAVGSWEWRVATYRRTVECNPWIPEDVRGRGLSENPKQRQFLLLSDVYEVFYGGAAGGGKTFATLVAATQFVDVPGYSALLLRENYGDLNKAGAWMDLSRQWWHGKGVRWNERDRQWTFPSGATITFGYLDSDRAVYQYDSASFQFVAIDELTQHSEFRYSFMFGRIRRPLVGPLSQVPLRMRSTSNPGNVGHGWVRKRFGCGRNPDLSAKEPGAVFVPATLKDNAGNLDVESYRRDSLSKLDPLTRAQREKGDWDAVAGGRFDPLWLGHTWAYDPHDRSRVVLSGGDCDGERFDPDRCPTFQTCDPAASKSSAADHFVLSTWKLTPRAGVVWWACQRHQLEIPEQVSLCQSSYRINRPQFVAVEEVANQRALAQLLRRSKNPPMVVRSVNPRSKDKLARAVGFINLAASGRLYLPERHGVFPLEDVRSELVRFTGTDEDASDDICLAAETGVATEFGERPIETIRPGERVWTRKGLRPVLAAGQTSASARVLRVTLDDGRELVGTANHPVFVVGTGFVRLDTLRYNSTVLVWNCSQRSKRSSSTGEPTADTRVRSVGSTGSTSSVAPRPVCDTCTATSGSFTTGRSRRGTRFTTATGTHSTTTRRTSSASRGPNTDASTPNAARTAPPPWSPTWRESGPWRPRGTGLMPVARGTPETGRPVGRNANRSPAPASGARRGTSPRRPETDSALPPVPPPRDATPGLTTRIAPAPPAERCSGPTGTARFGLALARVATVSEHGRCAVFNLTVAGEHEYFANGILTHNCDTGSYMAELLPTVRAGGGGSGGVSAPVPWSPRQTPWGGMR